MRYLFLFLILSACCRIATAQRISRQEYIEKYSSLTISGMKSSGIPASITMAQACLESDDGNSSLAKEANNHFGIKCHSTWDGEKMYKDDDTKNECFRKYKKAEESFKDHTEFLTNTRRYASLFELKADDYKGWAKGLKDAGYATNPRYPDMLIKIIEDNKLYELDKGVEITKPKEVKHKEPKVKKHDDNPLEITIGGREVLVNNSRNFIISKQGDSYESLTKEYEKMSWELYKFNDVTSDSILTPGAMVYLQPKRNSPERGHDTHIVKPGETIHSISQLYGIKTKSLLKKNNLSSGDMISPGNTLYLRKNKPVNQ